MDAFTVSPATANSRLRTAAAVACAVMAAAATLPAGASAAHADPVATTPAGAAAPSTPANPLAAALPALGLPGAAAPAMASLAANRGTSAAASLPAVRWTLLTSGGQHSCGYIAASRQVRCWGSDRHQATDVPIDLGAIRSLSAGARHTCAVTAAGKLECWGDNSEGQAEDPDVGQVSSVSAGALHTCVVSMGGAPWCWGDNTYGQSEVPESLERVRSISAGLAHTCAVTLANRAVCWGASDDTPDEADNRDKGQADVPSSVGSVLQVSAGGYHSCALKTNRELACWGYDYNGQAEPTELNDLYAPFRQVSAGLYHSCAVSMDGGVPCFGSDDQGQATPPELEGPASFVASGGGHSCAQSSEGDIACWGSDAEGQATPPDLVMMSVSRNGAGTITGITSAGGIEQEDHPPIKCGTLGTRCLVAVERASRVSLGATPDRGSRFVGWSGACTGRGTCWVTMTSARSVVANFASNRPCIVPRTAGATLQAASAAIAKAGCTLGAVSKVRSRTRSGLVISSTPGAGAYRPLKSKVSLVLSRGSR